MRILLRGVPAAFADGSRPPNAPLVLGGLLPEETRMGLLRVRCKRHRWHPGKVLKCNDPLVLSVGWRRYEAAPLFSIEVRSH